MREIVVVFKHDSNQHIGGDERIHEHEENDKDFRVENAI